MNEAKFTQEEIGYTNIYQFDLCAIDNEDDIYSGKIFGSFYLIYPECVCQNWGDAGEALDEYYVAQIDYDKADEEYRVKSKKASITSIHQVSNENNDPQVEEKNREAQEELSRSSTNRMEAENRKIEVKDNTEKAKEFSAITVIPKKDFVGWNRKKDGWECYQLAEEQMRLAGYSLPYGWAKTQNGEDKIGNVYQMYLAEDMDSKITNWSNVAVVKKDPETKKNVTKYYNFLYLKNMQKGARYNDFIQGVKYIKDCIQNNVPVLIGVEHGGSVTNKDYTTDHFVVIVGIGADEDDDKKYFTFFENAVNENAVDENKIEKGTDLSKNRLYIDCLNSKLVGTSAWTTRQYIVAQVRESNKIKK